MMDRRMWREPSFDLMGKVLQVNWLYVMLLCCLAGVGYVALYSAAGGAPEPYATRHAMRFAVGVVIMLAIGLVDIRVIAKLAWPAWFGGVILLVLVLRMGHVGKGAQRWLELGGLQLQPSELMKLALVLALASWFHRASWERMGNPL
ncbi:MAG: FtsW/RodA/SpoVE family cell cycle protein, partial [Rhodopila sp.]|nr:FtsW/RodA/SpoVE family cell cycle protein [Rhodopila sp.]